MGEKPNDSSMLKDLRIRVGNWLRQHNQKQSTLASQCGVNAADFTRFLNSGRSLPIYALANLAAELDIDLVHLLLYWEHSHWLKKLHKESSEKESPSTQNKIRGWERATEAFESLLQSLPSGESIHAPSLEPAKLSEWPTAFLPMVVFVGDRRESPPQSPADLLAASASMGDLYYFSKLQLPPETEIRSDKTGVIASSESLRNLVQDKNILIIGSPAANLMARAVNSGACFSFHVAHEAAAQAAEFQEILEPIRYFPGDLERYTGINSVTSSEKEWSRRRRYLIYGFARSGILDPVDYNGLRATSIPSHLDYGVVTLCRHPWSETKVAIMAAGLHGPATAAAVKLLSQKKAFVQRPFGGVFHVYVPINAPWEQRYHHLNPEWDTHEYSAESYAAAVKEFADKYQKDLQGQFRFWNPKDVQVLLKLVGSHDELPT